MHKRSANKKWLLIGFSVVGLAFLLLVAGEDIMDMSGLSGTMAERAPVALEDMEAAWATSSSGVANRGRLDDTFGVTISAVNKTNESRLEELTLYFSRDPEFTTEDDCQIDRKSVTIDSATKASVQFRTSARLVDCLDAGPWYAAVRSQDGVWSSLDTVYYVENGDAEVRVESVTKHVAPRGQMELELEVNRPATATGFDGLYDFPVDVWLQQGELLCFIEAETFTLPRDPVAQISRTWMPTPIKLSVDLREAKQVERTSMSYSPFALTEELDAVRSCTNCTPPVQKGNCSLTEGPVQVTAGPTMQGFKVVQEMYHHAAPVVVETGKITVSVLAGESVLVSRTAYNPSNNKVTWSSESEGNTEWVLGISNQFLPGRKPSTIGFTVTAADLEPGVYDGTVIVKADDFYGTETKLSVELTVLPARNVVSEATPEAELPGSFTLGNYPNPFNPQTTIRFELPERGQTTLVVYDVSGRLVRTLQDGELSAGIHEVRFDAGDLPSGTYLYRLTTPSSTRTEKMVLLK